MASVGFCVVSTTKRGYPLEDATHIAFSKIHTHIHKLTPFALKDSSDNFGIFQPGPYFPICRCVGVCVCMIDGYNSF